MTSAFVRDLDERLAGHILHTFVRFVHEFEQFVDDGFQKLPMLPQEPRILTDDVPITGKF
jgi:hypothetical protein